MKKKVLALLMVALLMMAVLTSCVKAEVDIRINIVGQISARMLLVFENKENGEPSVKAEDVLKGLRPTIIDELKEKGFTVTEYNQDGYSGLLIENNNVDINNLQFDDDSSQTEKIEVTFKMEGDRLVLDIPLSFLSNYASLLDSAKTQIEEKGGYARASITTPFKPANHNADEVTNNGKTLTWNAFMLGSKESIHVEYSIVPLILIGVGVLAGVAAVVVGTVFIVKAVKKKKVATAGA
ncbi:MAG: hypothetical protein K6F14_07390 [Clostridiales bacterium]|nr:hypothetical protein [Clostridiales bacterium]